MQARIRDSDRVAAGDGIVSCEAEAGALLTALMLGTSSTRQRRRQAPARRGATLHHPMAGVDGRCAPIHRSAASCKPWQAEGQ